jgi:hypothetical protein
MRPFCSLEYLQKGGSFPQSGYDELDSTLISPRPDHYRVTPSPGGPVDRYGELKDVTKHHPTPRVAHQQNKPHSRAELFGFHTSQGCINIRSLEHP